MDLTSNDHRINNLTKIVYRDEVDDFHFPSFGIHFDFTDMSTRRIGKILGIIERFFGQSGFKFIQRVITGHVGGESDFWKRDRLV